MRLRPQRGVRPLNVLVLAGATVLGGVLLGPVGQASLTGSGQLNDIVSLLPGTTSIASSSLTSTSGGPVAAGTAFSASNSLSNVDTLMRYSWGTTPYYGSSASQTTITLHGTTYNIGDLLWFKQEVDGASTTVSQYFSPPLIKNNGASHVTWTSAGTACATWTGSAAAGFVPTSAGNFTFQYYDATTQTDDTPSTSAAYFYCLDTTNTQVYINTAASYTGGVLVKQYTVNSSAGNLQTYQYAFKPGSYTVGNSYCMTGVTGSGTAATPDLTQCQLMSYSLVTSVTVKMWPLFDPAPYFPSGNQGGGSAAVTYGLVGTQWDPYSYTTTNGL